jgi:hypothetical protein
MAGCLEGEKSDGGNSPKSPIYKRFRLEEDKVADPWFAIFSSRNLQIFRPILIKSRPRVTCLPRQAFTSWH